MKIHDVSAQDTFPNKLYTTYELVVIVAAARRAGVFTHLQIFHNSLSNTTSFSQTSLNCQRDDITATEFLSAVVKIP